MAGCDLNSYTGSNTTFALSGMPMLGNKLMPASEFILEEEIAITKTPLVVMLPPSSGTSGGTSVRSMAFTMTPCNGAKVKRATPKRTSTGAIGLKKMHIKEHGPSCRPGKHYKGSLVMPLGHVVHHSYSISPIPASSPLPSPRFTIVGVKKPKGGYGKALNPKLTPKEKEQAESSSQPLRIKRVRKSTSVQCSPTPFESDEEEALPKGPTISSLSATSKNHVRGY